MRRPAPISLGDITHPGPRSPDRRPFLPCRADPVAIPLDTGEPLLEAFGNWAEAEGYCSALLSLDGLALLGV